MNDLQFMPGPANPSFQGRAEEALIGQSVEAGPYTVNACDFR
jgi:hypothetical protein